MDVIRGSAAERFANRVEAGAELASRLAHLANRTDVIVLGLPRGGVPVAAEVARRIGAPLDVFVVRKLGVPTHRELAMGAIASGGARVLNQNVISWLHIPDSVIRAAEAEESKELERQDRLYRGNRPPLDLGHKIVVLVDDGLATGSTMRAAVQAVRRLEPSRVVVAVPVGSPEACQSLSAICDAVVCPRIPATFSAVGQWYVDFSQTSDEEVRALLAQRPPETAPTGV